MAIMQAPAQAGSDVAPKAKPTIRVFVDGGQGVTRAQDLQIPQSHDDMMALLSQRRVINEQLEQATDRRNDLLEQMNEAPASAKTGFQAQLNVLNDRIVQLASSLKVIGQEKIRSRRRACAAAAPYGRFGAPQEIGERNGSDGDRDRAHL